MNKILNYLRHGKGRGLLIILLVSLLFTGIVYVECNELIRNLMAEPGASEFVNEMPTLTIQNGIVQGDVIWARPIPATGGIPLVIDTSIDKITLPQRPGYYLTRRALTVVSPEGAALYEFLPTLSARLSIRTLLDMIPVVTPIATFIIFWLGFLVSVAFTALLAWLARIPTQKHRTWRTTALTYIALGILSIIAAYTIHLGLGFYPWIGATTLISVIILNILREKEI